MSLVKEGIISLYKHIQHKHAYQSRNGYNGFHHRPCFKRVLDAKPEIFFKQPEAAIIYVREHQATCTDGQHHQGGMYGLLLNQWQ